MEGNPYLFDEGITQKGYFKIDKDTFKHISKIAIFSDSFEYQDDTKPNDIFISDIQILGTNVLSEASRTGNAMYFKFPQGYVFSELNYATETKSVVA